MFTVPWAFLTLASLPALAGLYLLRNAYRQVPVSSLMLWLEQAESRASGLRVKRLQTPLLFFLEILALLLLAIAATGPRMETYLGAGPLVVVLDDSYSMQAGGEDSPHQRARAAVEEIWREAPDARFILAGNFPRSLGEPARSSSELATILAPWTCRAPTARLAEGIALATELAGDKARILVLSDHGPPAELQPGRVQWQSFGEPLANFALVQAHRDTAAGEDRISVEIANLADAAARPTLVLVHDDREEVHREEIPLEKGQSKRLTLKFKTPLPGPVVVKLDDDALNVDNKAWLLPREQEPIRVDLQIADEPLRALMKKTLDATGRAVIVAGKPQLLITDASELPNKVDAETWTLQIHREKNAVAYGGPFVIDRSHPLTEGIDLAGQAWGAGESPDLPGMPIILAGNIPLVSDTENAIGQHLLQMRLRPDLSTLTESPAWPALLWNLAQWRSSELPGLSRVNLRLGESTTLSLPLGLDTVTVTPDDGPARKLAVFNQKVIIEPADVGLSTIRAGEETYRLAASALRRDESDLSSAVTGRWGEWEEDPYNASMWIHFAWILLLVTLAVLTIHMLLARRA